MAKLSILAGATSQSVNIFVQDTSQTNGAGLTGLVFNSANLIAYYTFAGANATATIISLATLAAVNSAYSSGGFKEIDSTHMPGVYRFDIPNAVLAAASGRSVLIMLSGAAKMAPILLEIELTAVDNQSTAFGLSLAKTTNITGFNDLTAAQIATGVWTDTTAGDFTTLTSPGKIIFAQLGGAFTTTSSSVFTVAALANAPSGSGSTPAAIATAVWQDLTSSSDFTTAGSIGKLLVTAIPNAVAGASGGILVSGSNSGTTTFGALTVTGNTTLSDGLLISRSTANSSAITATGNGTGTGAIFSSGAGATGDGVQMTAASTNGNGLKLTKAGTGSDFNASSTPLILAKTTNITGFNDIAATAIVSGGAITTSSGAVSTVTSVTNTVTANTTQLAGQTVTAAAGVTFPTSVASPTNITAGTITTVTNLTNAPTAGDFTATMKTSLNASTPASITGAVGSVTGNVGGNVTGSVGSVVARVTANTDQFAGQTISAAAGVTVPSVIASPTNITAGTITTVTNLTNAPTAGDFTATMKTSLNASTPASVTTVTGNVNGSVNSVTTPVGITSNVKKNQALNAFTFLMTDATTHTPKTGLTVAATRSLDGGAFASCANTVTEISSGWYFINLATTDMNANVVSLRFTAASSDDRDIQIVTQP